MYAVSPIPNLTWGEGNGNGKGKWAIKRAGHTFKPLQIPERSAFAGAKHNPPWAMNFGLGLFPLYAYYTLRAQFFEGFGSHRVHFIFLHSSTIVSAADLTHPNLPVRNKLFNAKK